MCVDAAADNGKVPPAADMLPLDSRFRGNDSAVVVDNTATDDNRAAAAVTVATVGDTVGNGAVATRDAYMRPLRPSFDGSDGVGNRAVAVGDGHVRPVGVGALRHDDATIATSGNTPKSSFPRKRESRINNSAQPTEFNAGTDTADKVRFAQSSALDTGSSPVWSVVGGVGDGVSTVAATAAIN